LTDEIMDVEQRIEQFTKMTEADPENELGHFSLGKALCEAGRYAEAERPLQRVLQLNPEYSKGYQLLAEVQLRLDRRADGIGTLRRGIDVADRRGDRMPRDEMARMLTDLGETPPAPPRQVAVQKVDAAGADLVCSRCGRPSQKMERRPFRGPLGERVWDSVCQTCWREWVSVGTKVINEMGLPLANPQAQQIYDEHMIEFLQLER